MTPIQHLTIEGYKVQDITKPYPIRSDPEEPDSLVHLSGLLLPYRFFLLADSSISCW